MTVRERQLARRLLDVLHEEDGRQLDELLLHARVHEQRPCSLAEFSGVLVLCDVRRWITGVPRLEGDEDRDRLWNINSRGESARLDLK